MKMLTAFAEPLRWVLAGEMAVSALPSAAAPDPAYRLAGGRPAYGANFPGAPGVAAHMHFCAKSIIDRFLSAIEQRLGAS
jgi:hypothetical protein